MRRWPAELLVSVALAAATLVSFAPVLENGFVNIDDAHYIEGNQQVRAGLTRTSSAWALTSFEASNWHPLTWWSLQLDRELYGPKPWGIHLTNLLLHTASAILLFLVFNRMAGAIWRSALVAALFAIHPLRVESVAWAAERKDVLSTLFWMLTMASYLGYVRHPRPGRYALVVLAFGLGLMAKPMLVTLPCVLLLLDFWPLRRWQPASPAAASAGRLVLEKLPLLALAALSSVLTLWAQRFGGAVISLQEYPLGDRVINAIVAYVRYLGITVWPSQLAAFYPLPRLGFPAWQVLGGGLLLAAITLFALQTARRWPYLAVGWLWYLGTLVPVIGLVQVGEQALADRYTYIPLIGIFLILAWGLPDLLAAQLWGKVVLAGTATVGLLALMACTRQQVRVWHDSFTLWTHALNADEENYFAHYNLGILLQEEGKLDDAQRRLDKAVDLQPKFMPAHYKLGVIAVQRGQFGEAVRHLDLVVRELPQLGDAHNQLGMALARQGKVQEGINHFREALRLNPMDADAHNNLGLALAMRGEPAESARHFEEAIRLDPEHAEAYNNLGLTLERAGQRTQAIACYQEAICLRPRDVSYRARLAQALYEEGQIKAARAEYREIARIDPGWLDRTMKTAWTLATHPNSRARNGTQSLQLARLVCQAGGEQRLESLDTLAAAAAETGQFDLAVTTARAALTRATAVKEPVDVMEKLRERLQLYEASQPFRDPAGGGPAKEPATERKNER